jgi:hypothetical protein
MRVSDGHLPMLYNIVLILLGLILFGVLAAIFEALGLKDHPYVARTLSAVIIAVGAYIHWGYHRRHIDVRHLQRLLGAPRIRASASAQCDERAVAAVD